MILASALAGVAKQVAAYDLHICFQIAACSAVVIAFLTTCTHDLHGLHLRTSSLPYFIFISTMLRVLDAISGRTRAFPLRILPVPNRS